MLRRNGDTFRHIDHFMVIKYGSSFDKTFCKNFKRALGYSLLRADGFEVKISHISRKTLKSVKCLFHEKHFGGCCSHTKRPFNHTQSQLGWLNHGGDGMDVFCLPAALMTS